MQATSKKSSMGRSKSPEGSTWKDRVHFISLRPREELYKVYKEKNEAMFELNVSDQKLISALMSIYATTNLITKDIIIEHIKKLKNYD